MRTISARQRDRLQRTVDERHGLALMGSREEVRQLRVNLEEEEYQHLLEKEALILRGKHQKSKDKEAVKQAEEKGARLNALVQAAEGCQRLLERRLMAQRKETKTAVGRCEALTVAQASWREAFDAKCVDFGFLNAKYKDALKDITQLRAELRAQKQETEAAFARYDGLKVAMGSLKFQFNSHCVNFDSLNAKYKEAQTTLTKLRPELAVKCEELQQLNSRFTIWKTQAEKKGREKKLKMESITTERDQLSIQLHKLQNDMGNEKKDLEAKNRGIKHDLAVSEKKFNKLQSEYDVLMQDRDAIVAQLHVEEERVGKLSTIRHMNERYFTFCIKEIFFTHFLYQSSLFLDEWMIIYPNTFSKTFPHYLICHKFKFYLDPKPLPSSVPLLLRTCH
jgi:chromosome segregation ATPase